MKISWHNALPFRLTWAQPFSRKSDVPGGVVHVSCTKLLLERLFNSITKNLYFLMKENHSREGKNYIWCKIYNRVTIIVTSLFKNTKIKRLKLENIFHVCETFTLKQNQLIYAICGLAIGVQRIKAGECNDPTPQTPGKEASINLNTFS